MLRSPSRQPRNDLPNAWASLPTWVRFGLALILIPSSFSRLELICQIHTAGGDLTEAGYEYCRSNKLPDHVRDMAVSLAQAGGLSLRAMFHFSTPANILY